LIIYGVQHKPLIFQEDVVMKKIIGIVCLVLSFFIMTSPIMAGAGKESDKDINLKFYYPVAVAGPLANIIGALCNEFNASHPGITIEPIYAGGYEQTLQRILTGYSAGNPGDIAVISKPFLWASVDEGAVLPLTEWIAGEGGTTFTDQFWKAYMNDGIINGVVYAIPFQRSVPLFYYNKDMFRDAGLDPEKPPATWAELRAYAEKLVIKKNGVTERWALEIPNADPWIYYSFILQNGGKIQNSEGTEVYFNTPEAVEAYEFAKGLIDNDLSPAKRSYGDASADFVAGATAMIYNSSGSLSFMRDSAKFDWGTTVLPYNKTRALPTGGAGLIMLKGMSPEKQKAAWEFFKWLATDERAAQWCIDTGYVATRPDAFETSILKAYLEKHPQVKTVLPSLEIAVSEPGMHNGAQVNQAFLDANEGILSGKLTIKDGLATAQSEADKILSIWKK
jgi:sn-glycerol 3-phosphate transport system substrate-binding protein